MSLDQAEAMDLVSSRGARKKHDQIVSWTNDQFKSIKTARTSVERQWYINLAFYRGKQHVVALREASIYGTSTRLFVPPAPYYRVRPTINRIRPTVRHELAQLTNNKPNASVVPASAEDRDLYAAMAAEQIWDNLYTEKRLRAVLRRALFWTLNCGTGFIKTYWDWKAGPVGLNEETGKEEPQGDVAIIHETPFHILVPDLREEELESQPFLIHAQLRSVEYVAAHYGSEVLKNSKGSLGAKDLLEESFTNLLGIPQYNKDRNVLILEVYAKPGCNKLFQEGAFFTICEGQVLYGQEGMPYGHGKYPFAKLDHIPSGGFYATSSTEDLVPLQKEYNRTRGQIIEAKNRMAKLQLLAARGSIDASKITTEPGQIIFYTPGMPEPKPLPLQALPNYVISEVDRLLLDWNDISGQHEVSKGNVPPGVTAATAISYLQERDESKLSPTFDSLEEGIEKTAGMSLWLVQEYWTDERVIKVTGPDGSFDAMAFKGSDLRNNIDIKIEAGSALPQSKAAKQALVMDFMKFGWVSPDKGLEVLDMGGLTKIYERIQTDKKQAQRENLRMSKVTPELLNQYNQENAQLLMQNPEHFGVNAATGEPLLPPLIVPVNTWDNHKVHIDYHNDFRKGQAFEMLPEEVKTLFEMHVQKHIEALGLETMTMEPRTAVGLPPVGLEQEESSEAAPPGPEPTPEMETI